VLFSLVAELPFFCTFISNRPHFFFACLLVLLSFLPIFIAIGDEENSFEAYFTASTRIVCLFVCLVRPDDNSRWSNSMAGVEFSVLSICSGEEFGFINSMESGMGSKAGVCHVLSCIVGGNVVCR
jgi:hypothetical protein